jgi:hypothetical protein
MVVHHIEVDEIGTRGDHGIDLGTQASEVCGEDGRRDPVRASTVGHCFSP